MKITAREIIQKKIALNFVYTGLLLRDMVRNMPPRWKQVATAYSADGTHKSIILDTEEKMEYVVSVAPAQRPTDVTVH